MARNGSDSDRREHVGYPADIAIPDGLGVRNEDDVGDERAATVRGRYLAQQSDLTDEQAHALAWRELGYTAVAIARRRDRAEGTIEGWLDRTAAQYGLCAIETKWPAKRQDFIPMTDDHLLAYHPAVRLQYRGVAERYPSVVPFEVMEPVRELNEYGTRPHSPASYCVPSRGNRRCQQQRETDVFCPRDRERMPLACDIVHASTVVLAPVSSPGMYKKILHCSCVVWR
jgi:hypothetical protein